MTATPTSDHFRPIELDGFFNARRGELEPKLRPDPTADPGYGEQTFMGIPFQLGEGTQRHTDVIHLNQTQVEIPISHTQARYLVFLHCVENIKTNYRTGLADNEIDGNWIGTHVSDYTLIYADGSRVSVPILRRRAIQQMWIGWGASPFEAVPHRKPPVSESATEAWARGDMPTTSYGYGEVRHDSGRGMQNLWLYALPNPHPDKPLAGLYLEPREEESAVYGISATNLTHHPLRWLSRRKLRLPVPPQAQVTDLHDVLGLDMDLGQIISARLVMEYETDQWNSALPEVQPSVQRDEVLVEHASHPSARLYAVTGEQAEPICELESLAPAALEVPPALRPVTLRFVDGESGQPVPVRLHMHGEHGEYLPPKGAHRRVNPNWFEDNYGEFVNQGNQYAYVMGECVADLPLGRVYIEVIRGLETRPIRQALDIGPETDEITLQLERVLDWRSRGWVSADTHVHFLSPTTAWLEGAAEGVNVVNLLASQWGEMFSNVTDFDGRTTLGAREFGGDGEFLVRVGTENRMHVLGHISLLGYAGQMIHPLCTGGPNESALGDPQENTMAEWAQRCIDQQGLVILPHAPNPQAERVADIVLGLVHGMEMMSFNPYQAQIRPYGLADWYRFLNLGYHIPVVGGSDKMSAASLLGGIRTYACVGYDEFTYERWMEAVREGYTFVTVGPLVDITVEGQRPGQSLNLPASGGRVHIEWKVDSIRMPVRQVEVLVGGHVVQSLEYGDEGDFAETGTLAVDLNQSTWVALRVRGSFGEYRDQIAAHSSAIMINVADSRHFDEQDAASILAQIEGARAYVDTLAPRPDGTRFETMRLVLERAYNRLHQRMHAQGVYHAHTPVMDPHED